MGAMTSALIDDVIKPVKLGSNGFASIVKWNEPSARGHLDNVVILGVQLIAGT